MLIIITTLLFFLYLMTFIGRKQESKQTETEIKELRSQTRDLSSRLYREEELKELPEPVQRYFRNVLNDGQSCISSVYLKHDGQFKTALHREWINIEGEQFISIEEPGFLWKGKTALFSVRDTFISGKGQIKVRLLNLFKVVDGRGPRYDQGEILRWLGESVWYPTNLLPGPRLQWNPIDKDTAELSFRYEDHKLNYKVSFNTDGEITELETQRFMGDESLETWIGRVSCYEDVNGVKIPMKIEALWKLDTAEYSYARFTVRMIEHK